MGLGAGVALGQVLAQNLGQGLQRRARARRRRQRPRRPAVRPDDVMATLEKLGELKAKGILTQEEFDAKKAELLKKLVVSAATRRPRSWPPTRPAARLPRRLPGLRRAGRVPLGAVDLRGLQLLPQHGGARRRHAARIGKMAELFDDHTPLQLGAAGRYQGQPFTLVGRLQYRYADGTWTEWHALFDDGGEPQRAG